MPDDSQALVNMGNSCGGLCGQGAYVIMENHNGRWVIVKEIITWVS
jgi:hypothetical protein